ncbi:MAG: PEP-CTERM sorting domain-containing protein [Sedimentisphaerales bacterium]
MKNRLIILVLLTLLIIAFTTFETRASYTVATFFDPAQTNSKYPLFDVNYATMKLTGGWPDSKTGLTLQIPWSGHTFSNAWFEVKQPIALSAPTMGYCSTGPGEVDFYKDNTSTNPLLIIQFDYGVMSPSGFGSNDAYALANVRITGSEITGTLSDEVFAFSFANRAYLPGSSKWSDGWTATASFTSSAIPEPATIGLLCMGGLAILRKKKRS